MIKYLFPLFAFCLASIGSAQDYPGFGTEVNLDLTELTSKAKKANAKSAVQIDIPMPSGELETVDFSTYKISEEQPSDVFTYSGKSSKSGANVRMTITPSALNIVLQYKSGYYFIDPLDASTGRYLMYNINDGPQGKCGTTQDVFEIKKITESIKKSVAPFPVGTQLRKYRMAAAATGEMTVAMTSQTLARDKIVAIMAAANLIYNLEASVQFDLIAKTTTSMSIIFTNGATDPFTPDPVFANATNAQTGFNTMNGNASLLYSEYDIGHVFHINNGGGISASGQAGPLPCSDTQKARAWTEFTAGAIPAGFVGFVAGLFVHEVGHQFQAWHTYNADGGTNNGETFCTGGWDNATAVEPGSGSTLMGYGGNCTNTGGGNSYVLTSPNNEQYFHTKSLEQIYNTVTASGCITLTATENTPPVANAGTDFEIPKGTPFALLGSASDVNGGNALSYVWDQYDIATAAGDRGALGSGINGYGGYPAVNSAASAPLFRSRISTTTPLRYFPDMQYILDGTNNPADNVGEDLPQVGRNMLFRFTVRDNVATGGGVDSDEVEVTVDGTKGPLEITSQNSTTTVTAGTNLNITWNVNSTNSISSTVDISLSVDGGVTFPFIISSGTSNDGSHTYAVPASAISTSEARIKISSTHHPTAEFFDINNSNFTISGGSCPAQASSLCPVVNVSADSGDNSLDLDENDRFIGSEVITSIDLNLNSNQGNTPLDNGSGGCDDPNFLRFHNWFEISVSNTGSYTFNTEQNTFLTIFQTSNYIYNSSNPCSGTFIGSTGSPAGGGSYYTGSNLTVSLTECVVYTAVIGHSSYSGFTTTMSGPGDVIETGSQAGGTSYTYIAVDQSNSIIDKVSSTADFKSLGTGSYNVYGVSYESSINTALWSGMSESNVFPFSTCAFKSSNYHSLTVTGPPCSITGLSASVAVCSGDNATFNMTFTPANGSGTYEVVNAANTVVGSGSSSPIAVTVSGPTSAGNQNFRVRDAAENSCISSAIAVNLPQCPPPCSITGVTAGSAACSGQDASFSITAFTPSNGSGTYEVVNASNQVVGSGIAAAIACTELGPTSSGNQDFRVRDASDNTCISSAVTVTIPTCILPCTESPGSNISGNVTSDSLWSKTYLTSNADVSSGNVKFQAPDSVVLQANFQVSTSGVFEVQIGDCEEIPE